MFSSLHFLQIKISLTRHQLLSALCCFVTIYAKPVVAGPDTIRMAAILPLSGEGASWGQAIKNGMEMAYDKLPVNIQSKIEIVYEDDAHSPRMSISALHKLLSAGPIDLVINESSATAKALAPILESKHIPLLAIASDPEVVHGRNFAFNFWVTPEEEAKVLLSEMQRRGYRRIARITTTHPGTLALNEAVDAIMPQDVSFILNEDYSSDVRDFRDFITKLRSRQKDTDAVMAVLTPGQLGIFSRQLRQMGVLLPLFGGETLEDNTEVVISQGTLVGSWYVSADDGAGTFLDEYRKRFPGASSGCAANGHDAVLLIARAIELQTKPGAIHEFLSRLRDFSGALGKYSSTDDHRFSLPARVKIVTQTGK